MKLENIKSNEPKGINLKDMIVPNKNAVEKLFLALTLWTGIAFISELNYIAVGEAVKQNNFTMSQIEQKLFDYPNRSGNALDRIKLQVTNIGYFGRLKYYHDIGLLK